MMKEETNIIHSIPVDPQYGAISVPIYQTSTFEQESPGANQGFDYSRSGNPTRLALENLVASLENGDAGFAFSSGLAAADTIVKLLKPGDQILAVDDIYGGTFRLFGKIYGKFGIDVKYIDTSYTGKVEEAISNKTKLVWLETPTNPTLKISDIAAIAQIAHDHEALLVVDNTFASPALQKPLDLGADIVFHSATKFLAGHSDVIAGVVVTKTKQLSEEIKFVQNACGAVLGPFDSWLTIRGIETLILRVQKQSENAGIIARALQNHPLVEHVNYPGLQKHQNYKVAAHQQSGFGGVLSFSLNDNTVESALAFIRSTNLFKLAESLGGVKSLISHPSSMTHKTIPEGLRVKAGIADSLIRLSVGIEHSQDLLDDVRQALEKTKEALVLA